MKKIFCTLIATAICVAAVAQNIGVIPQPQIVELKQGIFDFTGCLVDISLVEREKLSSVISDLADLGIMTTSNIKEIKKAKRVIHVSRATIEKHDIPNVDQAYILDVTENNVDLLATSTQGLYYGMQTLCQLISNAKLQNSTSIPCMHIVDYPAMEYRGWMDDISRGPIPTMDFIKKEIRTMARFKMNCFNLYTEHVFRLNSHPDIAPIDGLTAEQIQELTEYADRYFVEFIGNQQCFAHAEKVLKSPAYHNITDTKYNVNPGVEETYSLLEDVFGEVAPAYKSRFFNINCDETESLGSGYAKNYVEKIGADEAYGRHIKRVYNILQKYNKEVLMWGDIVTKNPEMIKTLPKDIQFIVWSYVAIDSFDELILPIKNSGHTFWIAPGMSMWSTIFPNVNSYMKNIANLVRDGYFYGAKGVFNTAWDDSGESLFNGAWHGMAWSADMSWKPLERTDVAKSDEQRNQRETQFNDNFNKIYFGEKDKDLVLLLYSVNDLSKQFGEIMNSSALYEPLLDFFPSKVCDEALQRIRNAQKVCMDIPDINISQDENRTILNNLAYAKQRFYVTTRRNELRIQLYKTLQEPSPVNVSSSKQMISEVFDLIKNLKNDYVRLWNYECRGYSRDIVTDRFDAILQELLDVDKRVFIDITLSDKYVPQISLRTIFNDKPIYYSTDGNKMMLPSKEYKEPFEISQSCLVRAICYDDYNNYVEDERYILYHKGMGHFKQLNTHYNGYRPAYSGGGDNALLDGVVGSDEDYSDGHWQGYCGEDLDVEMDFGKSIPVNDISMRFLQKASDWILSPKDIEFYTSKDGKIWILAHKEHLTPDFAKPGIIVNTVPVHNIGLNTRYLRVVAKYPGPLPDWHPARGYDSFIFCDEIVVE